MPSRAGSPNRNKNAALLLLQKKLGKDFHPLTEMGDLYEACTDEERPIKAGLLKEMAQYTLPKLKSVELSGEVTQKVLTVAQQIQAAEDAINGKD